MFARLLRSSKSETLRPRNAARLGCEQLEDRLVPGIPSFKVDVTLDTPFHHFGMNFNTNQMAPLDAGGGTSLRAVVEWGNANPQNGNWNMNHINVDFSLIAGATIELTELTPLHLNTNFNFLANVGAPVTIERSAEPGTPAFRLFVVWANTESHFTGMTLTNGQTASFGGAIRNDGTAYINYCTFTDNYAGTDGGAIATVSGAKTHIYSCTFVGNSAGGDGGAVAALSDSLATSFDTCTLVGNSAKRHGGAISAEGAGSLLISASTISDNHATGFNSLGGGVYVGTDSETSTLATIGYTNITNNTAGFRGGGLYVQDCDLGMTGGSLSANIAEQDGGGFFIDADNKTVTLYQVSVTQNTATNGKGGGGYLRKGTLAGSLTALTGNASGMAGFAGIAWKTGSTATITVPGNQQTVVNDP